MKLKSFKQGDLAIRKSNLKVGIAEDSAYTRDVVKIVKVTKYHTIFQHYPFTDNRSFILLNEKWDDGNWIRWKG